ncbi:MAG: hypothetical protein MUC43_09185 [Pirellula sp.]|nr:hypothetical protein [Pirellula sp.]
MRFRFFVHSNCSRAAVLIAFLITLTLSMPTHAGVSAAAIKELIELVSKKFGSEMSEDAVKALPRGVEQAVKAGGADAVQAIQKLGPKAIRLIDSSGDEATLAARLLAKYGDDATELVSNPGPMNLVKSLGDDAAETFIKHGAPAEGVLNVGGLAASKAANQLTSRHGRQLIMLAEEESTKQLVRSEALMGTIAKLGDKGMDFVWKNKGALLAVGAITAFVANPEPFIDGTASLAQVAAESVANPIADGIANRTNWTLVIVVLAALIAAYALIKNWIKRTLRAAS